MHALEVDDDEAWAAYRSSLEDLYKAPTRIGRPPLPRSIRSKMTTAIAACLVRHLAEHHLTQTAFAQLIDVSPNTISKWVRGERIPHPKYIPALTVALGLPKEDVRDLIDKPRPGYLDRYPITAKETVRTLAQFGDASVEDGRMMLDGRAMQVRSFNSLKAEYEEAREAESLEPFWEEDDGYIEWLSEWLATDPDQRSSTIPAAWKSRTKPMWYDK